MQDEIEELRRDVERLKRQVAERTWPLDQMLTPEDAAKKLGKTVKALARQRDKREGLPYYRIGHRIRYALTDVIDELDRARVEPGE